MDTPSTRRDSTHPHRLIYVWVAAGVTIVVGVLAYSKFYAHETSPIQVAVAVGIAVAGIFVIGWLQQYFFSFLVGRGIALERVAVFGASAAGIKLAHRIKAEGLNRGQLLVGIFDNRSSRSGEGINDFGLSGDWETVKYLASNQKIDHVIICLPFQAKTRLQTMMDEIVGVAVKVTLVPDDGGIFSQFIELENVPIRGWQNVAKSILDRGGAAVGLIIISPLLLFVAILIKLDSKGSVFFLQERVGHNNLRIKVFKFRTMHGPGEDGQNMSQAQTNDPRITRIGGFLRRFSIDELPQAINVVLGDMSLVGPRPHAPGDKAAGVFFYDVFDGYAFRHKVKPGITGWAQVNGLRGRTDTKEKLIKRVQYDLYYVNNWSFLFDIEILLRTIPAIFRG